jgi:hypothetical protein
MTEPKREALQLWWTAAVSTSQSNQSAWTSRQTAK